MYIYIQNIKVKRKTQTAPQQFKQNSKNTKQKNKEKTQQSSNNISICL